MKTMQQDENFFEVLTLDECLSEDTYKPLLQLYNLGSCKRRWSMVVHIDVASTTRGDMSKQVQDVVREYRKVLKSLWSLIYPDNPRLG